MTPHTHPVTLALASVLLTLGEEDQTFIEIETVVCFCLCVADICRVCRSEGTPDKPLYHPCVCTGSIKFIHQEW